MVGLACKPTKSLCGSVADVDRLHAKINTIVGMNYLGIIDVYHYDRDSINHLHWVYDYRRFYSCK